MRAVHSNSAITKGAKPNTHSSLAPNTVAARSQEGLRLLSCRRRDRVCDHAGRGLRPSGSQRCQDHLHIHDLWEFSRAGAVHPTFLRTIVAARSVVTAATKLKSFDLAAFADGIAVAVIRIAMKFSIGTGRGGETFLKSRHTCKQNQADRWSEAQGNRGWLLPGVIPNNSLMTGQVPLADGGVDCSQRGGRSW